MKLKVVAWVAAAAVGTLVVLTIIAALGSRTEPLRKLVVATLQDRLDSDVDLKAFSVDLFPSVTVRGDGLTLRLRNLSDPSIPPFIQIERFTVHCGLFDLMRRPRRFKHVTLEGLVINIPPGGLKKHGNPIARLGKGGDNDGDGQRERRVPDHHRRASCRRRASPHHPEARGQAAQGVRDSCADDADSLGRRRSRCRSPRR